ncbi:MAG: LysR family transcriptional regulator [Verrucomicrobiota bacterium]
MHEFWSTSPFDLYELHLFRLVVEHGSFTKAAGIAGLTQSAITRQLQGMEKSLGIELLKRTTRRVETTAAGDFLYRSSARMLRDVEQTLRRLREEFAGARKEIRVGVSRGVGMAYLPGLLHANLRHAPEIGYHVSYQSSAELLTRVEADELDLGVLCPPRRLPGALRVTHRFDDGFALIAPKERAAAFNAEPRESRLAWLNRQEWLLIEGTSNTGRQLREWMSQEGMQVAPAMQLDSFDLIINLVALGMGISFVPIRALALYGRKRTLQRLPFTARFVRELIVVVRRNEKTPGHLTQFVENILF